MNTDKTKLILIGVYRCSSVAKLSSPIPTEKYYSGVTSLFVFRGNVRDHVAPAILSAPSATSAPSRFDLRFSQRLGASAVKN